MPKILIIEDEEILRQLMVTELSDKGYEVTQAENGQQGLELVTSVHPDLILLDLLMPVMSGYDFLHALRSMSDTNLATVPCVVLSNSGQTDDLNRAYECGANDVLIKTDFNPNQLVVKVEEQLGRL